MTIAQQAEDHAPATLRTVLGRVLVALVVLAAAAALGFVAGTHHETAGAIHTGRAYVGEGQASVRVGDRWAGFAVTANSMTWFDARGVRHDGGIPPCLQRAGRHAWITFGTGSAQFPDDSSTDIVTWVRCTHAP